MVVRADAVYTSSATNPRLPIDWECSCYGTPFHGSTPYPSSLVTSFDFRKHQNDGSIAFFDFFIGGPKEDGTGDWNYMDPKTSIVTPGHSFPTSDENSTGAALPVFWVFSDTSDSAVTEPSKVWSDSSFVGWNLSGGWSRTSACNVGTPPTQGGTSELVFATPDPANAADGQCDYAGLIKGTASPPSLPTDPILSSQAPRLSFLSAWNVGSDTTLDVSGEVIVVPPPPPPPATSNFSKLNTGGYVCGNFVDPNLSPTNSPQIDLQEGQGLSQVAFDFDPSTDQESNLHGWDLASVSAWAGQHIDNDGSLGVGRSQTDINNNFVDQAVSVQLNLHNLTPNVEYALFASWTGNAATSDPTVDPGNPSGPPFNGMTLDALFPPTIETTPATNLTAASASLNGQINTNSTDQTAYFEYGLTRSYGQTTPPQAFSANSGPQAVTASLTGLPCGTSYHFHLVGHLALFPNPNEGAVLVSGADQILTTVACNPSFFMGNASVNEGLSGTTNAVFTLTLAPRSTTQATVEYTTADNTAKAGVDYEAVSGTITFPRGVSSRTITVPVIGGTAYEPSKTFFVNLFNAEGAVIAGAQGVGTILDTDTPGTFEFSAAAYSSPEYQSATITVTRSLGAQGSATVAYAATAGTAIAGTDFSPVSGVLTFASGVKSRTFTVPLLDNLAPSGDVTVDLALNTPTGGASVGSPDSAVLTIVQANEPATTDWHVAQRGIPGGYLWRYGIAASSSTYVQVGEQGSIWTSPDTVTWTESVNPNPGTDLTSVTYGGGQFVAVGSIFYYPASADTATILTSPDGINWTQQVPPASGGMKYWGIGFGGGTYVAVAGAGGISSSPDGVSWSQAISPTTQDLSGVAYGNGTFVAVGTSGTILTSPDGATWTAQTSNVTVNLAAITYSGAQFIAVGANSAGVRFPTVAGSPASPTILTSPDGVTWTQQGAPTTDALTSVASGGGITVVLGTHGSILSSADGVTWDASQVQDPGPGIPSDQWSSGLDAVGFGPSGFIVTGRGATYASPDGISPFVSHTSPASRTYLGVANDGVRFCAVGAYGAIASSPDGITWTQETGPDAHVYYQWDAVIHANGLFVTTGSNNSIATSPDCVHWTVRNPLEISRPSDTNGYLTGVAYGAGRYVAAGWNITGDPSLPNYLRSNFPVLFTSRDAISWTPISSPAITTSVTSGLAAVTYMGGQFVIIGWGNTAFTSPDGLTWTQQPYSDFSNLVSSGGAGASDEFADYADGRYINVFNQYGPSPISIQTSLDGVTWTTQNTPPINSVNAVAHALKGTRIVVVGSSTILYADFLEPTISVDDVTVTKPASGKTTAAFTVSLSGAAHQVVTVQYQTADGTGTAGTDYLFSSGTLTFSVGTTSKTVNVPVVGDMTLEGPKTFFLNLSGASGAPIGRSEGQGTILDKGVAGSFSFSSGTYSVTETTAFVKITIQRTGGSGPGSVVLSSSDGTAKAGTNYGGGQTTLTFAPGVTSQSVNLPILDDHVHTGTLTFLLTLGNPSGLDASIGSQGTTVVSIVDADPFQALSFTAGSYTVNENTPFAPITVRRTGGTAGTVTVVYQSSAGTATTLDYTDVSGTLTFGPGISSQTFDVFIAGGLNLLSPATVNLALSLPGGGAFLGSPSSAVLTIEDNELQSLSFSAPTYSRSEAMASAMITVNRSGPTTGTVTVDYTTADGTATTGTDYTSVLGTLTFGPGVKMQSFAVPILKDTNDDGTETVLLYLQNPGGGAVVGSPSASVLDLTDIQPVIEFSAVAYPASEASGSATITVRRTGGTTTVATVEYQTEDATALAWRDYVPVSGRLTFGVGVAQLTFKVPLLDNELGEGSTTLTLTLGNPTGLPLGTPSQASLTITHPHAGGKIQLSAPEYSVASGGPVVITVLRTGGTGAGETVAYSTADGTGLAGTHYQTATGAITFGEGETARTFVVQTLEDGLADGNHNFTINLGPIGGGAAAGTPISANVWVIEPPPSVAIRLSNIDDNGFAYLNGSQVASAGYFQDTGFVNVTSLMQNGPNNIRFVLQNISGGWTYDFEIRKNGIIVFHDQCGQVGVVGCMNNDPTIGTVYDKTVVVSEP